RIEVHLDEIDAGRRSGRQILAVQIDLDRLADAKVGHGLAEIQMIGPCKGAVRAARIGTAKDGIAKRSNVLAGSNVLAQLDPSKLLDVALERQVHASDRKAGADVEANRRAAEGERGAATHLERGRILGEVDRSRGLVLVDYPVD